MFILFNSDERNSLSENFRNSQVIREGSDITLVGWGAQLAVMEQACLDAEKVCMSSI